MPSPLRPAALLAAPFTVDQAVAAGLTRNSLQSSAWRRVFRDVWVPAELPDDAEHRLAAVRLVLPPYAVLCGLTAAWVHGVDVRRRNDLDVHVSLPKDHRVRSRPGLVVRQETLAPADVTAVGGVRITTAQRTAFDCLRWLRGAERLVVADALAHAGLVDVEALRDYAAAQRGVRNVRVARALVDAVEPRSESAMETRLRVVLLDTGLPRPVAQWEVRNAWGELAGRLDLAYPQARLGVEYDGADHWQSRRADDRRRAAIRELGWEVLVFSADDVFATPVATGAAVMRALRARAA